MTHKNIYYNPHLNALEEILARPEVAGLEFEKVVYANEYEAVAVFKVK